jgi:DNA-binding PadR family transcriptional regulator
MKITNEKLKVLTALKSGPKQHKDLRMAYYGPIRYQNPSNTSFYNQLQRMMEDELIQKTATGIYTITDLGREELAKLNF